MYVYLTNLYTLWKLKSSYKDGALEPILGKRIVKFGWQSYSLISNLRVLPTTVWLTPIRVQSQREVTDDSIATAQQ